MRELAPAIKSAFVEVEQRILSDFNWNPWFVTEYWPANRPRLVRMLAEAARVCPPAGGAALADIGCGNGYMSRVFARAGYRVTGVDGYDDAGRSKAFFDAGIEYVSASFNSDLPLASLPAEGFDFVLCGEVIEHVLNHPLGFVNGLRRILRAGGYMIITTPNPCTLMNAVRMLRGTYSLWGTPEFIDTPKYEAGKAITVGEIHYREYRGGELIDMVQRAGFGVVQHTYVGAGANRADGKLKRAIKESFVGRYLMGTRLFGAGHIVVARAC